MNEEKTIDKKTIDSIINNDENSNLHEENFNNIKSLFEFNCEKIFCSLNKTQNDEYLKENYDLILDELCNRLDEKDFLFNNQSNFFKKFLNILNNDNLEIKLKLVEKLYEYSQSISELNYPKNIILILTQLIHPLINNSFNKLSGKKFNYMMIEIRKIANKTLGNILKFFENEKEIQVYEYLTQIRIYCNSLHEFNCNIHKNENENLSYQDEYELTSNNVQTIKHPIEIISNIMKISFDEHYRYLINHLGGVESILELLIIEHEYHGILLTNCENFENFKPKLNNVLNNFDCVTLRRYASMALTNLTFGDKQIKNYLCSNQIFLQALLAQLSCFFSEELIQVTSSVLRNLSWNASKICKTMLSEADVSTILMKCAMQVKKETTLKCILYALWNLSAHSVMNKKKICDLDGSIKYLISLLEYKSINNTLAIIENGGGVLKNVSSYIAEKENLRKLLRLHNCHLILLNQLKSTSLTIVCNSVGTLWNISSNNLLDQKILIDLGAIQMLHNLIFSKHKLIAMACKATLKNLLNSKCINSSSEVELLKFKFLSDSSLNCSLLSQRKEKILKMELLENLEKNEFESFPQLKHDKKIDIKSDCLEDNTSNENIDSNNIFSKFSNSFNNINEKNNLDQNYQLDDDFDNLDDSICEIDSKSYFTNNNYNKIFCNLEQKMISSIDFTPGHSTSPKRSSIYSTFSEPVMYYPPFHLDKDDDTSNKKNLVNSYVKNNFEMYGLENIFYAYPVFINKSNEIMSDQNQNQVLNSNSNITNIENDFFQIELNSNPVQVIQLQSNKIEIEVQEKKKLTKDENQKLDKKKGFKSRIPKSKTLDKNLCKLKDSPKFNSINSFTSKSFIDELSNLDYDNDLTYSVEDTKPNLTYTLPVSESTDKTLKNNSTTDHTLVWHPDNDDDKTENNFNEITFNKNVVDNNLDEDSIILNQDDIMISIASKSFESLILDGDHCTEITDSISFVENVKPPSIYHEVPDSITNSLISNLSKSLVSKNENENTFKLKSNNSLKNVIKKLPKSRIQAPKTSLNNSQTNTYTMTSKTLTSKKQSQIKNQLITSGYQTSLNGSLLNSFSSIGFIDKIKPPPLLQDISRFSSTYSSVSSIKTDFCDSLNSSLNKSFKNINLNTSVQSIKLKNSKYDTNNNLKNLEENPKSFKPKLPSKANIVKPVTRLPPLNTNNNINIKKSSGFDTYRKSKISTKNLTKEVQSKEKTLHNLKTSSSLEIKLKNNLTKDKEAKNNVNLNKNKIIFLKEVPKKIDHLEIGKNQVNRRLPNSFSANEIAVKKSQTKLNSLWKKTISNQQNLTSKNIKKHQLDLVNEKKKNNESKILPPNFTKSNLNAKNLIRSCTFEKLPTSSKEALKLAPNSINKCRIRPIDKDKKTVRHFK